MEHGSCMRFSFLGVLFCSFSFLFNPCTVHKVYSLFANPLAHIYAHGTIVLFR